MHAIKKSALLALITVPILCLSDAPVIEPGTSLTLTEADGGGMDFKPDPLGAGNLNPVYHGTKFDKNTMMVQAKSTVVNLIHPTTQWASSQVYTDFKVSESDYLYGVVPLTIAVKYSYDISTSALSLHNIACSLGLSIEDITDADNIKPVASIDLQSHEKTGDQGFTDIVIGGQVMRGYGELGCVSAWLLRGHTYRVTFQATSHTIGATGTSGTMKGTLASLSIISGDDVFETVSDHDMEIKSDLVKHDTEVKTQVSMHDTDVKAQMTTHDTDMKTQLSTHDAEIKELLNEIREQNEQIIELLLTPQGRRETEEGNFPLKQDPPVNEKNQKKGKGL